MLLTYPPAVRKLHTVYGAQDVVSSGRMEKMRKNGRGNALMEVAGVILPMTAVEHVIRRPSSLT